MKLKTLIASVTLALLSMASLLFANTQGGSSPVEDGWKALGENNQQQAEAKFISAIKEDRNNTRAYLSLSFLYSLQKKDKQSWDAFNNVLQIEPNFYPYVYAALSTLKVGNNIDNPASGIVAILEKLSAGPDTPGTLKATASSVLGLYYERRGDILKAKRAYQNVNGIRDWTLAGPFENISASGIDKAYPPEAEYDFAKTYEGKNGIPAKWFKAEVVSYDHWVKLDRYFAHGESVFYANTFVYSPAKQTVQIRTGASGALRAFLNDELILENLEENNSVHDAYVVETELQEGWNRLLIKCGYSEIDACNFLSRITDKAGEAVSGLQVATDAKPYKSKPGAAVKPVEHFAEAFFKARIKENPARLENYLLLAECYLGNDKAIEAEITLREAIKLSPNCALLYNHLLEAYRSGGKDDELSTTVEKIYALDKSIPGVIEYKISEHIDNDEMDKAEELVKQIEKLLPESERVYELYLTLYEEKDQSEKVIEISKKGLSKFPANWTFAHYESYISIEATRKYDRAISIVEDYLKRRYTEEALVTLADYYLKASNLKKWQETYNKIVEMNPTDRDSYHQMAQVYSSLQDYVNAEKNIKKALELCPSNSVYWSSLGEIYRIKKAADLSKQAYAQALRYDPTDYDSRRILRELDGKKSVFSLFDTIDVASLMKNSPDQKAYPEDAGVILFRDLKRVVYEQGASESSEEILAKVFNKRGIDAFKERWISYNGYTEQMNIEKAVVIKSNGSEIKADINQNQIIFKSLEENDFVYIKWSIKNYYTGKLSGDFWDTCYLNDYVPVKNVRYSLLVPEAFKFRYSAQNMPGEPAKKQTEDGVLYRWALTDEPAVEYEYGMPGLGDVGKVLYISSVDDWEAIISWYSDLARTKTKASFEIKEQVENLFKGKEKLSEEEKIATVYNFITENVRYSSVSFRQSGLVPQKARDVLVNKIGDCKDVATLCIAMLGELGIKAHYVLVNTKDMGLNKNALPSILFNHCIVAVETGSGLKYLDLTANNFAMGSVPEPDIDAFSLLIKPGVKATEYIPRNKFASSNVIRNSAVVITDDKNIVVESKLSTRGAISGVFRTAFRHKGQKDQEKLLTDILSRSFPNVKLSRLEINELDELKPQLNVAYNYEVPNYLNEAGQFKLLRVPWSESLSNNNALSYEKRNFPYNFVTWVDSIVEEIAIKMPAGYEPVDMVKEAKFTSSVADYSVSFTFADGVIKARREWNNKKTVVLPEEYAEFKAFYNNAVKEDARQILLKAKL